MRYFALSGLILALSVAPAAEAQVDLNFSLQVDQGAQTWQAFAQLNDPGNLSAGLGGLDFNVLGTGGISVTSSVFELPQPTEFDGGSGFFQKGFKVFRNNGTNGLGMRGSQDNISNALSPLGSGNDAILAGVGEMPVVETNLTLPDTNIAFPALIASGSYTANGSGTLDIEGFSVSTTLLPTTGFTNQSFATFSPDAVNGDSIFIGPNIVMDLVHVDSFTDASLATSLGPDPLLPSANPTRVHQFDVLGSLSSLGATEDFWLAAFDVLAGSGLTPVSGPGGQLWEPVGGTYDSGSGIENHWQNDNDDFGSDPNDLLTILVEAASGEADNRQYGETPRPKAGDPDALGHPTKLGSVYVQYDGSSTSLDLNPTPALGSPWGTYTANGSGTGTPTGQPGSAFTGDTVSLPENVLIGDADLNNIVNFEDFVALSNNFNLTNAGWSGGDFDFNNLTNFEDFVGLSNNFGATLPSGASVPEPGTLITLAGVALCALRLRR